MTKKELGLPHIDDATDRQKNDRMCWESEDELYNDGTAFKESPVVLRPELLSRSLLTTIFGYCKKEVKTQISFATNLAGGYGKKNMAGGALAFASYNLGDEFQVNSVRYNGRTFADVARDYADRVEVAPEGYGIDKYYPNLIYIPEDAFAVSQRTNESAGNVTARLVRSRCYRRMFTLLRPVISFVWRNIPPRPLGASSELR